MPGLVAPLVGAWIEIRYFIEKLVDKIVAPLVGAWIEINDPHVVLPLNMVAPLVGAWIEIQITLFNKLGIIMSLLS